MPQKVNMHEQLSPQLTRHYTRDVTEAVLLSSSLLIIALYGLA